MDAFDMVVIGAGPAGEKAAAQAAYWGKRVAMVDRAEGPGGVGSSNRRGPIEDPARDCPVHHWISTPGHLRAESPARSHARS